jgi:hypothetical protein
MAALVVALGGSAIGCYASTSPEGESSSALLICGPKSDTVAASDGTPIGSVDVSNDDDSIRFDITTTTPIVGVRLFADLPVDEGGPIPFADGDLALSTIDESFAPTTTRSYDIPFADLGMTCLSRVKFVIRLTLEDGAIAWVYGSNPDYIYWNGDIPWDYYAACEASCEPPPPESSGCTYTQGYWTNHPGDWPTDTLDLGYASYSQAQLLALFRTPTRGDESLILAHQLIAAKLNVTGPASDPDIDAVIDAADAWLWANADADGRLPFGGGSADRYTAISLAAQLDAFNNGVTGPGHCD